MTKQYICIREWARNAKGDIVDSYEYGRFPKEIQSKCFELKVEKKRPLTARNVEIPTVKVKSPKLQTPDTPE